MDAPVPMAARTLNLGVLAHVDAGKTSLTERLLFDAGVIDEIGSVDKGSTQTDSLDLERQRGITIRSAVVSLVVDGVAINLIDTPGHPDFIAEVDRALSVLDGCVLVVSAVEGVQAQTLLLIRALQRLRVPTVLFVNKIDRMGADPPRVIEAIRKRLSPAVIPMGRVSDPGTRQATFVAFHHDDRAWGTLAARTSEARLHPIFFGSAMTGAGVPELVHALTELLPVIEPDHDSPLAARVFKVDRDSAGHRTGYVRVFTGRLRVRDQLPAQGRTQRVTALQVFDRGRWIPAPSVGGGQIARVWGLAEVRVGDDIGHPTGRSGHSQFAAPTLESVVRPRDPGQRQALDAALRQLADQDPLINVRRDGVQQELMVSLYGEVQKDVVEATLDSEYGVQVEFGSTTTICIERPIGGGSAVELIRRNPFLATVGLRVDPAPPGTGIDFRLEVDVSDIPLYVYKTVKAFGEAMAHHVRATLRQGLFGWKVTDCMVAMTDCAYSPPGTNAADFRKLTPLVLMAALRRAGTVVCEPVHRFHLEAPRDLLGALLPAIARLGAQSGGSSVHGEVCVVEGSVRAADVNALQYRLSGLTRGEGVLVEAFDRYEPARGKPPRRAREAPDPLDRKQYLAAVRR